jgi:adenylosuccinate lyase
MSESVMIALANKGVGRQEAHEEIRKLAMTAQQKSVDLKEMLNESELVKSNLSFEELDKAMDPMNYIGSSVQIVENTLNRIRD